MDAWDKTYGVYTLDEAEGTFNDDFHTFGLYWDENEMVRRGPQAMGAGNG